MNVLLDTCTFLWILSDPSKLSANSIQVFNDPANRCFVSVISEWELAIQSSLGRLKVAQPLTVFLPSQRIQHGIELLDLSEQAALYVTNLPKVHRDPFDRMLICQAITEQMPILTPDQFITQYPVKVIW